MNGNNYVEQELARAHCEELRRQAERFRLAHSVRVDNGETGVHRVVLARVGKVLSALGDSLQERYKTMEEDRSVCLGECRPKTA